MRRFLVCKEPPPPPKRQSPAAAGTSGTSAASTESQPRYCDCPICGASIPFAAINAHLDSGCGQSSPQVPAAPAARQPQPAAPAARQIQPTAPAPAPAPASSGSAFAPLMAAAKAAATPLHWRLADGSCGPAWGAAGGGGWSAEFVVKASGQRVQLHAPAPLTAQPPSAATARTAFSASVLKSALQKNVRLCRPMQAVRVAWALWQLPDADGRGSSGALELLRRLPVIAVEDSLPPTDFCAVVWLLAAHSKGYPLTTDHALLVLRFVAHIAAVPWREPDGADKEPTLAAAAAAAAAAGGDGDGGGGGAAALAAAMLVRASFGGMGGDVAMLRRAAGKWHARHAMQLDRGFNWDAQLRRAFAEEGNPALAAATEGSSRLAELGLRPGDVPPSSVDHHCSGVIEAVLRQPRVRRDVESALGGGGGGGGDGGGLGDALASACQQAMWAHSSSTTTKRIWHAGRMEPDEQPAGPKVAAVWAAIEGPCAQYARELIRRCMATTPAAAAPAAGPAPAPAHAPATGRGPARGLVATPHAELDGLWLVRDFVSEGEEALLLGWLDGPSAPGWRLKSLNGPSHGQKWGVVTDLKARTVRPPDVPMPHQLLELAARMRSIREASSAIADGDGSADGGLGGAPAGGAPLPLLASFSPNEANAISYLKAEGHYLSPHVDDRQLSGLVLANLSLGSDAVMSYSRDRGGGGGGGGGGGEVRVVLPARSLQLQTGAVRYSWRHGIRNADLLGERRVSVTFRQARLT